MTSERHAFTNLDGLRGLAALVVLGRHVPDPTFRQMFPGGYLAVDFFFVLSGFVLAHAYQHRLEQGMRARHFMALRYIRILPQYWLATALGAGLIGVSLLLGRSEASLPQWATACVLATVLLPLPSGIWSGGTALFPLNLPAWSLFFELVGNAAYATIGYRLSGRGLTALLAIAGLVLGLAAIRQHGLDGGGGWASFSIGIARILFSYAAGMAVHRIWAAGYRPPRVAALLAPGLLLAVLALPSGASPGRTAIDLAIVLSLPALVLLGAGAGSGLQGLFVRLGQASYGIYVFHVPIVGAVEVALRKLRYPSLAEAAQLGTLAVATVVFLLALLLERFDGKLRTAIRQRLARRPTL